VPPIWRTWGASDRACSPSRCCYIPCVARHAAPRQARALREPFRKPLPDGRGFLTVPSTSEAALACRASMLVQQVERIGAIVHEIQPGSARLGRCSRATATVADAVAPPVGLERLERLA
jgi:hypothetical protein